MQRLQENSETSKQLLGKLDVTPGPFKEMEGYQREGLLCVVKITKQRAILLMGSIEKRYPKSLRSLKMHCPMKGNHLAIS